MADPPPRPIIEDFWSTIFETDSQASPGTDMSLHQDLVALWRPITPDEIIKHRAKLGTSPGPDGISARLARSIPPGILARLFNLILWNGKMPPRFKESRTILLPKKSGRLEPSDYRPITISSVLLRQLNSILATRAMELFEWDQRQRGFQPTDGCLDNTTILEMVLKESYSTYTSCYMALLDVSKAFDSVSFPAIESTLISYGFPQKFINYIQDLYRGSSTVIRGEGWYSREIRPKRGVKQGDPLSPVLFNLVIDRLLRSLPDEIGVKIDNTRINSLAYADDIIVFASTSRGLQKLFDHCNTYLQSCGMALNPSKCKTLSIKGQPKQKNVIVITNNFCINNNIVPSISSAEEWTYLGVRFNSRGRSKVYLGEFIVEPLERLTKAPLKPQQRMFALLVFLIPRLYHQLVLGTTTISALNKVDNIIRHYIRRWLNLPLDVPTAFFYTDIAVDLALLPLAGQLHACEESG